MPGFAGALTDKQTADLVAYLRGHFTDQPAWKDVDGAVAEVRRGSAQP
jgi:mono/diheme cytochrome c family protein